MIAAIWLKAVNSQYVCAENGGGQQLIANRANPQDWETFALIDPGQVVLSHGDKVVFQVHNGQYICAEGGGGQDLVANRDIPSTWETFTVERTNGRQGVIQNGDAIAFRACNGLYVCAEGDGMQNLNATRPQIGPWETFNIRLVGTPPLRAHKKSSLSPTQHMEAYLQVAQNGLITGQVTLISDLALAGFTGAVVLALVDGAGNAFETADIGSWGVDGRDVLWSNVKSPRTVVVSDKHVDPMAMEKALAAVLLFYENSRGDLLDHLREALDISRAISDIIRLFK